MRHYEVTFIVDPVLSGDEVKSTANHVQNELQTFGASIDAVDEIGLRQLAYPINRRSTGVYYTVQFSCTDPSFLAKFELNLKRNERLLRFLTVKLDKYGVKYNDDRRNGRIGKRSKERTAESAAATTPEQTDVVDLDANPFAE